MAVDNQFHKITCVSIVSLLSLANCHCMVSDISCHWIEFGTHLETNIKENRLIADCSALQHEAHQRPPYASPQVMFQWMTAAATTFWQVALPAACRKPLSLGSE